MIFHTVQSATKYWRLAWLSLWNKKKCQQNNIQECQDSGRIWIWQTSLVWNFFLIRPALLVPSFFPANDCFVIILQKWKHDYCASILQMNWSMIVFGYKDIWSPLSLMFCTSEQRKILFRPTGLVEFRKYLIVIHHKKKTMT